MQLPSDSLKNMVWNSQVISKIWVSLVVNAAYWLEWVMGRSSQGWDNYSSWVNDMQNLGQMRSNYNLSFLSGQFFFFFFGSSPNHVFQKVLAWLRILFDERSDGANYPFCWWSMFSFCCKLIQETEHYFSFHKNYFKLA